METNEDCEEVRMQMCELLHIVVARVKHELVWTFVQPIVDNVRALLMDPFKNVQMEALEMTKTLTLKSTEVIYHYVELIGRALLPSISSRSSKLRIKGLEVMCYLMSVNNHKHN